MPRQRNEHLIILRGLPASGKTRRASEILEEYDSGDAFSTDDFFRDHNGRWMSPTLGQRHAAHKQLEADVLEAMQNRVHPIVIDNTNVHRWEMWAYVNMAFYQGYYVIFEDLQDPTIPLKTRHRWSGESISLKTLQNMQENYEYKVNFYMIFYSPNVKIKYMQMNRKMRSFW